MNSRLTYNYRRIIRELALKGVEKYTLSQQVCTPPTYTKFVSFWYFQLVFFSGRVVLNTDIQKQISLNKVYGLSHICIINSELSYILYDYTEKFYYCKKLEIDIVAC